MSQKIYERYPKSFRQKLYGRGTNNVIKSIFSKRRKDMKNIGMQKPTIKFK